MRTSVGIGLAALIGLTGSVGCTTDTTHIVTTQPAAAPTESDDDATSETDPTDPATDPTDPTTAPASPLVEGLAISEIAVFQGVKVSVAKSGAAVAASKRNAPVVVGRPALVRVYVKPDAGWASKSVTAELRLVSASSTKQAPIAKDTKTISKASTDASSTSTFNFEVDAESLTADVTFQVALTDDEGSVPTGKSAARFPQDGTFASLGAETSGKIRIVVVPVKYMSDGSGRTPDVSAAQLTRYKNMMMARYPTTEVEVTARAPFSYASAINSNGSGFSQVLSAVTQLRKTDGVDSDVYYYGALAPASSFSSFCNQGCVTGLSTVVDEANLAYLRASVGVGFAGDDSANTMAHEVGHAHGRSHAPCGGTQGADPDFPYSTGSIGVWGYNILDKTMLNPSVGHDMMGYCENEWVSDYTYAALFDRVAAVNKAAPKPTTGSFASASGTPANGPSANVATLAKSTTSLRLATVAEDGSLSWGDAIDSDAAPTGGELRTVTFVGAHDEAIGSETAHFYRYDHLPGGVLVMPSAPVVRVPSVSTAAPRLPADWKAVRIQGFAAQLPR